MGPAGSASLLPIRDSRREPVAEWSVGAAGAECGGKQGVHQPAFFASLAAGRMDCGQQGAMWTRKRADLLLNAQARARSHGPCKRQGQRGQRGQHPHLKKSPRPNTQMAHREARMAAVSWPEMYLRACVRRVEAGGTWRGEGWKERPAGRRCAHQEWVSRHRAELQGR